MRKMLVTLLVAGTVSFAGISPAAAQGVQTAYVKIPFQFIAGDRALPAGTYWISRQTDDWSVVMLSGERGNASAFVSTRGVPNPNPGSNKVNLVFATYFGQHFLQQIALPGRDARVVDVTKTNAERTLAKLNLMPIEHADSAK